MSKPGFDELVRRALAELLRDRKIEHSDLERRLDFAAGLVERLIDGRAPLDLDHLRRILLLAGVPPVRFLARLFHNEATMPSREDVAELVGRASSALEELRCRADDLDPQEGGSTSSTEGEA